MKEIKIIKWLSWEDAEDYPEGSREHEKILYRTLKEKGYIICGSTHQFACVPIFSDGVKLTYSYRVWGHIMADVRNDVENTSQYDYMDFYMPSYLHKDEVLPVKIN